MRYWKTRDIQENQRVGIGVATYVESEHSHRAALLRTLVACFRAQTWQNWKMVIMHDGPFLHNHGMLKFFTEEISSDPRVTVVETKERKKQFGHPWRQSALDALCGTCQWVMLTNDDNYYAPVFLEWMLFTGVSTPKPGCDMVHCDMIHSHKHWRHMSTVPKYRQMDLGGFMVRSSVAKAVPFDRNEFNADGDWINRLAAKCKGRIQKVPAVLFVHN